MKQNPVAWLTALVAVLTAVDGTLQGMHVLTATQSAWAAGIIAVLTAILGTIARANVTPLANPRDRAGRKLVPHNDTSRTTGRQLG